MKFAEKITRLCEGKGWSRAELGRRTGVSRTTAGYWCDDVRKPFDDALFRLADAFGVSVDFLTDDAQDDPPAPSLSDDEAYILKTVRAAGLSGEDVVRAIMAYAQQRPTPGLPTKTTTHVLGPDGAEIPPYQQRAAAEARPKPGRTG